MSNAVTLKLKKINTTDVNIGINIPPDIEGHFKGKAIIRSKEQMKELGKQLDDGFFETEEALLRSMYTGFSGLGDDEGKPLSDDEHWQSILHGPLGTYLTNAAIKQYFDQYGEALAKNWQRRRLR